LSAICVAATAVFALAACDDQSSAQRDDPAAPQVDQQLGELPSATPNPTPVEPPAN
jgi:hypothetical protein